MNKTSAKITLEGLLQHATAHLEETRAHPVAPEVDPGFRLAFGDYVEGHALSFVPPICIRDVALIGVLN